MSNQQAMESARQAIAWAASENIPVDESECIEGRHVILLSLDKRHAAISFIQSTGRVRLYDRGRQTGEEFAWGIRVSGWGSDIWRKSGLDFGGQTHER